jgi:hypothetical protein
VRASCTPVRTSRRMHPSGRNAEEDCAAVAVPARTGRWPRELHQCPHNPGPWRTHAAMPDRPPIDGLPARLTNGVAAWLRIGRVLPWVVASCVPLRPWVGRACGRVRPEQGAAPRRAAQAARTWLSSSQRRDCATARMHTAMAETRGGSGRSLTAGKERAKTIPPPQNHRSRYNIGRAKHGRICRPWDLLGHRNSRHDQANHEDRQEESQR